MFVVFAIFTSQAQNRPTVLKRSPGQYAGAVFYKASGPAREHTSRLYYTVRVVPARHTSPCGHRYVLVVCLCVWTDRDD